MRTWRRQCTATTSRQQQTVPFCENYAEYRGQDQRVGDSGCQAPKDLNDEQHTIIGFLFHCVGQVVTLAADKMNAATSLLVQVQRFASSCSTA